MRNPERIPGGRWLALGLLSLSEMSLGQQMPPNGPLRWSVVPDGGRSPSILIDHSATEFQRIQRRNVEVSKDASIPGLDSGASLNVARITGAPLAPQVTPSPRVPSEVLRWWRVPDAGGAPFTTLTPSTSGFQGLDKVVPRTPPRYSPPGWGVDLPRNPRIILQLDPPEEEGLPGRMPDTSQQQTIDGGSAGVLVASARKSVGLEGAAVYVSTEALDEQKQCDDGLKAGRSAFSAWRTNRKPTKGNGADRVSFDTFDAWSRTLSNADESTVQVGKVVRQALTNCFDVVAPSDFPKPLEMRLGVLAGPNGVRECSGLQVGVDKVLTARHCMKRSNGRGGSRDATDREIVTYRFEMSGGISYNVTGIHASGRTRQLADEWILLKTVPMKAPQGELPLVPSPQIIEPGAPMLVAGLVLPLDRKDVSPGFSRGDSCRAVYATGACVVHTCNTVPGLSGAPLFVKSANQWMLAGVHVRSMGNADFSGAACDHPAKEAARTSKANGGVYVPAILR